MCTTGSDTVSKTTSIHKTGTTFTLQNIISEYIRKYNFVSLQKEIINIKKDIMGLSGVRSTLELLTEKTKLPAPISQKKIKLNRVQWGSL